MNIESMTIGKKQVFEKDARVIYVNDLYDVFRTVANYLFQKNSVSLFTPVFSPHFACEVNAYGDKVVRKVDTVATEGYNNGKIERRIELSDITTVPTKASSLYSSYKYARKAARDFFYSDIDTRLCFFDSRKEYDYISQAEKYWDLSDEADRGFDKEERKRIEEAIADFKRNFAPVDLDFCQVGFDNLFDEYVFYTAPSNDPTPYSMREQKRIKAICEFFISNALYKAAYDAVGIESPPLFLYDSLDEMSLPAIKLILFLAYQTNRQVFFVEMYDNEIDPELFDQTVIFDEEEEL